MIPAEVQHSYFNFNPRSPCGERHGFPRHPCNRVQFQSTLPVRGATNFSFVSFYLKHISIHAPRAGSDLRPHAGSRKGRLYFNPRSPCGERRQKPGLLSPYGIFQSTLPVRGATQTLFALCHRQHISIHAPRAGSDHVRLPLFLPARNFNPRSPCGERRMTFPLKCAPITFQSTLPVRGATSAGTPRRRGTENFNPRSPCGERRD